MDAVKCLMRVAQLAQLACALHVKAGLQVLRKRSFVQQAVLQIIGITVVIMAVTKAVSNCSARNPWHFRDFCRFGQESDIYNFQLLQKFTRTPRTRV
jgi:hypothetical protein